MNYCIKWPGYIEAGGYGQINSNQQGTLRTARVILEQKLSRKIREGYQVHHICYNTSCINPLHIEEKTQKENIKDRYNQIRSNYPTISLTKETVYLVKYLIKIGKNIDFISEHLKVVYSEGFEHQNLINIPIKLIQCINDWVVWDYITLDNYEKVKALVKLEDILPKNECIETDWGDANNNYPVVQINYKTIPAHRYAYSIYSKRPIPNGQIVRHIYCDNKKCIRPQHLALGTQLSNMDDKIRKRRQSREKLLDNMEEEIVRLKDAENLSFREIGRNLATSLGREKPIDHKMISNRYYKYKLSLGQEITIKPKTQNELLLENMQLVISMIDEYKYSYRKTSIELGKKLRDGKPFDQKALKEFYLKHRDIHI